jgi:hypothetical protein
VKEALSGASSNFLFKAPGAMTVTALDCIVTAATSATINVQECDSAGANCTDVATSDLVKLDISAEDTTGDVSVTVTYTSP